MKRERPEATEVERVRLPLSMIKRLATWAKADQRTRSSLIRLLLARALNENGR